MKVELEMGFGKVQVGNLKLGDGFLDKDGDACILGQFCHAEKAFQVMVISDGVVYTLAAHELVTPVPMKVVRDD